MPRVSKCGGPARDDTARDNEAIEWLAVRMSISPAALKKLLNKELLRRRAAKPKVGPAPTVTSRLSDDQVRRIANEISAYRFFGNDSDGHRKVSAKLINDAADALLTPAQLKNTKTRRLMRQSVRQRVYRQVSSTASESARGRWRREVSEANKAARSLSRQL